MSWQTMVSAPKDGTRIDIWRIRWVLKSALSPDVEMEGERITDCWWDHGTRWLSAIPFPLTVVAENKNG